jgi:hypothetical protein
MNYNDHRQAVRAAWDAVLEEFLSDLIYSKPLSCYVVIDANGGPTRY